MSIEELMDKFIEYNQTYENYKNLLELKLNIGFTISEEEQLKLKKLKFKKDYYYDKYLESRNKLIKKK